MEPRSAERGNASRRIHQGLLRKASMEPRSAERGNLELRCAARDHACRFNGATLSRTWKQDHHRRGP